MNGALIDTNDRFGRRVILTNRQWDVHVLSNKSWMNDLLYLVELAIASPSCTFHDKEFTDRECFYLIGHRDLPGEVMKVVIRYNADNEGFVITAFPRRNVNAGEVRIWPT